MNLFEKGLVRRVLKPRITSDTPGKCVLQLGALNLLPLDASPYMHYINDALSLLPWVRGSETEGSGRITVDYAAPDGSAAKIQRWLETAVEEALRMSDTMDMKTASEEEIVQGELERLRPLVSRYA